MKSTYRYCFFILLFFSAFILNGCSKSSRNGSQKKANIYNTTKPISQEPLKSKSKSENNKNRNVVQMKKEGGVYHIPVKVNDFELDFIFDTGAGMISISDLEAMILIKQGKLFEEDIKDTRNFIDATGTVSEGTVINLRSVVIGNKELTNIEASVVHNLQAPLLLGQTALEMFGKISIDYFNNTISFEE